MLLKLLQLYSAFLHLTLYKFVYFIASLLWMFASLLIQIGIGQVIFKIFNQAMLILDSNSKRCRIIYCKLIFLVYFRIPQYMKNISPAINFSFNIGAKLIHYFSVYRYLILWIYYIQVSFRFCKRVIQLANCNFQISFILVQ